MQLAGMVGVLIAGEVFRRTLGLVHRRQASCRHLLCNKGHAGAGPVRCRSLRNDFRENVVGFLLDTAVELTVPPDEHASLRIERVHGDTGCGKRLAVVPAQMPAAMFDLHRAIGTGRVQIFPGNPPVIAGSRVVVLEAEHPTAGRRIGGTGMYGTCDLVDAA